MVSEYEYAAIGDLENFSGIDYSTVNATIFSDTNIDAKITIAERMVNTFLGVSTKLTVTDAIKTTTITIATHLVHMNMISAGYGSTATEMYLVNIMQTLVFYLRGESLVSVDFIRMNGADN